MENMLALLGAGDATVLLIQLFLRQLPTPVRTALASSPLARTNDCRGLVEEADRILLASRQSVMAAVADRTPGRQDPTQREDSGLCFYYRRFGTKAKRCAPPCSFPSQENVGAGTP